MRIYISKDLKIDFGNKKEDPLNNLEFFSKWKPNEVCNKNNIPVSPSNFVNYV